MQPDSRADKRSAPSAWISLACAAVIGCAHTPMAKPGQMPWSERMAIPLTGIAWPRQLNNALLIHEIANVNETAMTCAQRSRELETEIEAKSRKANGYQLATAIAGGTTTGLVGGGQFFKEDTAKANY